MLDPLKLAAAAVEFGMARYGNGETRGSAIPLVLKLFCLACVGTGSGFAVAALFLYLMPVIGPAGAALSAAGALFVAGAMAAGLSRYLSRPARSRQLAQRPALDLESAIADAEGFVRDNKALTLAAAFIAGVLVADETSKPRHR
jgi:hypothetical protein